MPASFIVSEYAILRDALKHYERHLERVSSEASNDEEQTMADEQRIKIESMLMAIRASAKQEWGIDL